jgi:hypothetical protein
MKLLACIGASLAMSSAFAGAADITRITGSVTIDGNREVGEATSGSTLSLLSFAAR